MSDFDDIFRKYYLPLYLYACKFIEETSVADIIDDVFEIIWMKKKYLLDEKKLKHYLYNSVKNASLNYLKHKKIVQEYYERSISLMEVEYYKSGEKSIIEEENLNEIYKAINSLSPIYIEVLEMSRFKGLKNKDIAKILDIPVRTVETRLFRALSFLKEKLSKRNFHVFLNINFRI